MTKYVAGILPVIAVLTLSAAKNYDNTRDEAGTIASVSENEATRAASDAAEASDAAVETALAALSVHVAASSSPTALRTAFGAYFNYRAANRDRVRKPFFYHVDLGLGNGTARGYVFDMEKLELVEGPFMVSHGRGSSRVRDAVPDTFSNKPGSFASSLGVYLAGATYKFSGKSGGVTYESVGLRLEGESGAFNDAAMARGIVAHGAPYVSATAAGRSEGCPAMEPARAARLLPKLEQGGVVFIYSPNDARWLSEEPWIDAELRSQWRRGALRSE